MTAILLLCSIALAKIKSERFNAKMELKGRSFLALKDWSADEIRFLLQVAENEKKASKAGAAKRRLEGKSLAMIFEKRSTRTRCAFETAFGEEGGHPVFLSTDDIQLGAKESLEDTARVLGRMFSAIEFRGFRQKTVEVLSEMSGVPVYNGLTDECHPTQALADIMTVREEFGSEAGKTLCFIGDGRNNVVHSLIVICAKLGVNCTVISPKELQPESSFLEEVAPWAAESGAKLSVSSDTASVKGADAIYTDVWASMGEESKRSERVRLLSPYQVNDGLFEACGNKACIFLHCLPAIKGEEVTESVIEGPMSRVWNEAENRKHTIKAIMLATLLDSDVYLS